ncbi:MT-A70 family protein [Oxytricha trifallax]|uniref:MT-A70 family protein n=1 Tax=Oxytricha trifallax TaxID=1172189 RepID=A0A073HYB2_9SPIT|nr:MT-A70 family protein [Oxytricha trifallax]
MDTHLNQTKIKPHNPYPSLFLKFCGKKGLLIFCGQIFKPLKIRWHKQVHKKITSQKQYNKSTMERKSKLPIIYLVQEFKSLFSGLQHNSSGALILTSQITISMNLGLQERAKIYRKGHVMDVTKYSSRSNDCIKHKLPCLSQYHKIKVIQKKKQEDNKQGFPHGPCIASVNVFKGYELLPLQRKNKNLEWKINTDPVVFDGDVRNHKMLEEIAADYFKRYKDLYKVVLINPAYTIKQTIPCPPLSDEEILALPVEIVKKRGIIILWFVNQQKDLTREFLRVHRYDEVEKGEWIKLTANLKLHNGSGMYTAHNNKSFLIGKIGMFQIL